MPKNVGDLGKLIVTKGCKNCPKCNKSPNLVTLLPMWRIWQRYRKDNCCQKCLNQLTKPFKDLRRTLNTFCIFLPPINEIDSMTRLWPIFQSSCNKYSYKIINNILWLFGNFEKCHLQKIHCCGLFLNKTLFQNWSHWRLD